MKCLITGVSGQLGYDVLKELTKRKITDIYAPNHNMMDITDEKQVMEVFDFIKPDVVFHCAAWTNVDLAEEKKIECRNVNYNGTVNITEACRKHNSKLIYISTDYVFDGKKDGIYDVNDITNPQNNYGKSKLDGENYVRTYNKHFIVRTSWVFGQNGKNFVKTMLNLSLNRNELSVVCDQVGSPTYTVDLARLLVDMSLTDRYGVYHGTNNGYCSWAEFADYIFKSNGKNVKVNYVTTDEYLKMLNKNQAYRPLNSKLNKNSLTDNGFETLPDWRCAIDRFNKKLILK